MKEIPINFRGLEKVFMVTVLEGNGKDVIYREVHYFFKEENGSLVMIGKNDPIGDLIKEK